MLLLKTERVEFDPVLAIPCLSCEDPWLVTACVGGAVAGGTLNSSPMIALSVTKFDKDVTCYHMLS